MGFTPFEFVGFGVVSNVRGLGLGYLHHTVFLSFGESEVFLVPLQTRATASANDVRPHGLATCASIVNRGRLKYLDSPDQTHSLLVVGAGGVLENPLWLGGYGCLTRGQGGMKGDGLGGCHA